MTEGDVTEAVNMTINCKPTDISLSGSSIQEMLC
jgi:hypothetical protein